MEEFKKALSKLLRDHEASIFVDEEDGFLSLGISVNNDKEDTEFVVDTGYRDLSITSSCLSKN